jgi:predicted nucleotidyltransferase
MVYTLNELKKIIKPIAVKYDLPAVYVFGSYARNEATENSDLDFAVTLTGSNARNIRYFGLYEDLCEVFSDKKVDVIAIEALIGDDYESKKQSTATLRQNIMKEGILIYG